MDIIHCLTRGVIRPYTPHQPQQQGNVQSVSAEEVADEEDQEADGEVTTSLGAQVEAAPAQASIAKTKPKRNARQPNRFGDYVPKHGRSYFDS